MKFMGKAVFATAAAVLAGGSAIGAGTADAAGLHGAIAFSRDQWTYGTDVDAFSRGEAIDNAMDNCAWEGATDCRVMVTWSNGCGALVYRNDHGDEYAVGAGTGPDRESALRDAFDHLARGYPRALLANVGSSDLSATAVSDVICTANA